MQEDQALVAWLDEHLDGSDRVIVAYASPRTVRIPPNDLVRRQCFVFDQSGKRMLRMDSQSPVAHLNIPYMIHVRIEPSMEIAMKQPWFEEFFLAYRVAAIWSSVDDNGGPIDDNYTVDDFSDESMEKMKFSCASFIVGNLSEIQSAILYHTGYTWAQAGHDFWLTRNGHGAGFWDRGLGNDGVLLSEAARNFGCSQIEAGCTLAVFDDKPIVNQEFYAF